VAEKPHDAVVKFDIVSKFTAASRGSPYDSTALVITALRRSYLMTLC